jgi:hypothetical protein
MKKYIVLLVTVLAFNLSNAQCEKSIDLTVTAKGFPLTEIMRNATPSDAIRGIEVGAEVSINHIVIGGVYQSLEGTGGDSAGLTLGYRNGIVFTVSALYDVNKQFNFSAKDWSGLDPTQNYTFTLGYQFGKITPTINYSKNLEYGLGLSYTF